MNLADWLHRHGLTHSAGVVAVSGGPDSIALAHMLLQSSQTVPVVLAHVNHQLRGDESDADEAFVRKMAEAWQVPCKTTRIPVADLAASEHGNLESIARRERYRWLTQITREDHAAWVATGHTADDQAETVLFRLLRGSGVLGLGGMPACRPLDGNVRLVRPLLTARRQEVLDYLHVHSIPYRIDSSNRDLRFTRNRLRAELMPLLERNYNPGVIDVLCRLADQARELHGHIQREAQELLAVAERPRAGDLLVFAIERLENADPNLVREMFRLVWQRENWSMGDMDFERWQRIVEITHGVRGACDFPGRLHVRRVGRILQLHAAPTSV